MQRARCRSIATLLSLLAIACIAAATAHARRPEPPILLVAGDRQHADGTASGDVYVVRADGTGLRRLHAWPHAIKDGHVYGAYSARWSPDGRAIGLMLAWWCGDPCGRLAQITTDGRLHTVPVHADIKSASWSSDWQAALTVYNADELWTISMDSGKGTRICCSRGQSASDPAWSPDAQELVVSTSRGLVRMTRDGKKVVPLTSWSRDDDSEWSPDGRSIAFIRRSRCSGQFECAKPDYIYIVPRSGKGVRRLPSTAGATSLLWLRDGRSIVFDAHSDIEIVRPGDGRARVLTSGHDDAVLASSPDGHTILFRRNAEDGGELWAMNADGTGARRLIHRARWTVLSADWRG